MQATKGTPAFLSSQLHPTPNFAWGPQQLILEVAGGMTTQVSEPMAKLLLYIENPSDKEYIWKEETS